MMRQPRSIKGRVAIVTGASGGIGQATASALVRQGLRVAIADLDQQRLQEVAAELDGDVLAIALDVTDADAYTRYIDTVEKRLGPVEVLVNVAGIMPVGRFEEESPDLTRRTLEVNLHAVISSTQEMARRMKARGSGHIINVASGVGWIAAGGAATYCATKFAVVGYSESVGLELQGTGVDISVVGPSIVTTEMSSGMKDARGLRAVTPEEVADAIVAGLLRPRFAIFVPRMMGIMALVVSGLPYPARRFLARITKTGTLMLQTDRAARAEYDARIGQSSRAG